MKVLFVCSGNAHRSPLAEALLKKSRPDLQADSAGIHITIPISGQARKYLARMNAEQHIKQAPEALDQKKLTDYDLIVAMEQRHKDAVLCRCPECEDKVLVWNIQDPYFLSSRDAQKIYGQIREKVKELARIL